MDRAAGFLHLPLRDVYIKCVCYQANETDPDRDVGCFGVRRLFAQQRQRAHDGNDSCAASAATSVARGNETRQAGAGENGNAVG